MQIGEVAGRTALTVDAIRFYEKRNLLPKAGRSASRFRLYTEDAIERIRFIRQMQGLGFSLREIGELIELRARKVESCKSVQRHPQPPPNAERRMERGRCRFPSFWRNLRFARM